MKGMARNECRISNHLCPSHTIQQSTEILFTNYARFPSTILACLPWSCGSCVVWDVLRPSRCFLRMLYASFPWFCLQLDFYAYHMQKFPLTRPLMKQVDNFLQGWRNFDTKSPVRFFSAENIRVISRLQSLWNNLPLERSLPQNTRPLRTTIVSMPRSTKEYDKRMNQNSWSGVSGHGVIFKAPDWYLRSRLEVQSQIKRIFLNRVSFFPDYCS